MFCTSKDSKAERIAYPSVSYFPLFLKVNFNPSSLLSLSSLLRKNFFTRFSAGPAGVAFSGSPLLAATERPTILLPILSVSTLLLLPESVCDEQVSVGAR